MSQESGKKLIYTFKAFLLSAAVSVVSMLSAAGMLYKGIAHNSQLKLYVFFIYFIASFVGGIYIGKKSEKRRFLCGMMYGFVFFCGVLIISVLVNGGKVEESIVLPLIICAIGGMVGGMLGH